MDEFIYNPGVDEFPSFLGATGEKGVSIFEDAGTDMTDAEDFASKQLRSQGMACALEWINAGDFSLDALDALIQGVSDLDGDGEVEAGGDEENYYNDIYGAVAQAFASLGADTDTIGKFIDDEDAGSGEAIGSALADKLDAVSLSDDALVSNFALSSDDAVMESTVKVIRAGKLVLKKKRLRRVKLSSAQRAGLKKARMKAFTSVAKHNRAKSMKIRKKRGL